MTMKTGAILMGLVILLGVMVGLATKTMMPCVSDKPLSKEPVRMRALASDAECEGRCNQRRRKKEECVATDSRVVPSRLCINLPPIDNPYQTCGPCIEGTWAKHTSGCQGPTCGEGYRDVKHQCTGTYCDPSTKPADIEEPCRNTSTCAWKVSTENTRWEPYATSAPEAHPQAPPEVKCASNQFDSYTLIPSDGVTKMDIGSCKLSDDGKWVTLPTSVVYWDGVYNGLYYNTTWDTKSNEECSDKCKSDTACMAWDRVSWKNTDGSDGSKCNLMTRRPTLLQGMARGVTGVRVGV